MVSNRAAAPFQSVFKIDIKQKPDPKTPPRQFIPRRAHRKSRHGCSGCKARRMKCDEAKPRCSKCTKLNAECSYPDASTPASSVLSTRSSPSSVTSEMYSMAMDLVNTDLDSLLFADLSWLPDTAPADLSQARMLQHFQSVASLTLGCSMVQNAMHSFVASDAWEYPYLMHMVLAISCAHQKYLHENDGRQTSSLSLAQATHWEKGLQLHRQHLSNLEPGSNNGNWDPAVATNFLLIMLTFTTDDDVPSNAAGDTFTRTIDPLAATGGFRSLMYLYADPQVQSKWMPVLMSADDVDGTFSSTAPGVDGIPRAFVELCGLDEDSNVENNPYHRTVRILTPCLHLKPSTENFATLFACMGRVWPELKTLLLKRDSRGLLLVAYWFALVRQIDQWWLTKRARSECMAIVQHLSTLHDPAIDALLPFPAAFEHADISNMWQLLSYIIDDSLPLGG